TDVNVSDVAITGLDPSTLREPQGRPEQGRGATGSGQAAPCAPGLVKKDTPYTCSADARVPANAKPTTPYFSDTYRKNPSSPAVNVFEPGVPFGVPFAPTPFRVTFHVKAGGADVTKELPIQFRYVKDIYNGDKRMEL